MPAATGRRRRLARSPGVRFKLDAEATWAPALVDQVAATGAVDTIDFKGHYGFEVADPGVDGKRCLVNIPVRQSTSALVVTAKREVT